MSPTFPYQKPGLVSAIRTLTALRIPGTDAKHLSEALHWFPLVGSLIGFALASLAVLLLTVIPAWPAGVAVLIVAVASLLTRGLHLDGLSDLVDAFGASPEKERRLTIMKDPHTGAFGVISLILVLLTKATAIAKIIAVTPTSSVIIPLMLPFLLSRTLQADLAMRLPYARKEGGKASPFVSPDMPSHSAILLWGLTAAILIGIFVVPQGSSQIPATTLLFAFLVTLLGSNLLGRFWLKNFGGITGDLLGASSEISETVALFCLAAISV